MLLYSTLAFLSAIAVTGVAAQNATGPATGKLGDATVVSNNPPGVVYTATLPEKAFFKDAFPSGGNVKGSVSAVASPNGVGVIFRVSFSNLPATGGPFIYHIHDQPVPADGNCTLTLAHLDPFQRGEDPACDSTSPKTCQVGDLSGKHGKITADYSGTYTDDFASTLPGIGAFFGNRSIVFHYANKTRISCANFAVVPNTNLTTTAAPNCTTSYSGGTVPTATPTQTYASANGAVANAPATLLTMGAASLFVALAFLL